LHRRAKRREGIERVHVHAHFQQRKDPLGRRFPKRRLQMSAPTVPLQTPNAIGICGRNEIIFMLIVGSIFLHFFRIVPPRLLSLVAQRCILRPPVGGVAGDEQSAAT
jgi:hypothetical protein